MTTLYQLTPRASKDNAFCWLTWEPQIRWGSAAANIGQFGAQEKRSRNIEEQRAAGVDPLHIAGLARTTPLDPMRFSVMSWNKRT